MYINTFYLLKGFHVLCTITTAMYIQLPIYHCRLDVRYRLYLITCEGNTRKVSIVQVVHRVRVSDGG